MGGTTERSPLGPNIWPKKYYFMSGGQSRDEIVKEGKSSTDYAMAGGSCTPTQKRLFQEVTRFPTFFTKQSTVSSNSHTPLQELQERTFCFVVGHIQSFVLMNKHSQALKHTRAQWLADLSDGCRRFVEGLALGRIGRAHVLLVPNGATRSMVRKSLGPWGFWDNRAVRCSSSLKGLSSYLSFSHARYWKEWERKTIGFRLKRPTSRSKRVGGEYTAEKKRIGKKKKNIPRRDESSQIPRAGAGSPGWVRRMASPPSPPPVTPPTPFLSPSWCRPPLESRYGTRLPHWTKDGLSMLIGRRWHYAFITRK